MTRSFRVLVLLCVSGSGLLLGQEPVTEAQLAAAVLPLPTSLREQAGVIRRIDGDRTEVVRESRNGMSCAADDPTDDRFDVRCYHDDFWSVISRARELRPTLDSWEAVSERIRDEAAAGELDLPSAPTAGYRMLGPIEAFDAASGKAGPEIARWQSIHFPFRTAREMGLPEEEEPNESSLTGLMPYVMASGTWWSHVMIVHEPFE